MYDDDNNHDGANYDDMTMFINVIMMTHDAIFMMCNVWCMMYAERCAMCNVPCIMYDARCMMYEDVLFMMQYV